MAILMERSLNTQCIAFCYVWGCTAVDQSGCPCWPLSTVESANNGCVSIRAGPQSNGIRWPGLINHVFFYITWMAMCVSYLGKTWHQDALVKKASGQRQCDALGIVLLGNLGSCHPCGCFLMVALASFRRIMRPATKQKWFRNGLRSTTTSLRCWLGLQIPQISIQSSICGMQNKQVRSMEAPPHNLQNFKNLLLTS